MELDQGGAGRGEATQSDTSVEEGWFRAAPQMESQAQPFSLRWRPRSEEELLFRLRRQEGAVESTLPCASWHHGLVTKDPLSDEVIKETETHL